MVRCLFIGAIALSSTIGFAQKGSLTTEAYGKRMMRPMGFRQAGTLEASATFSPSVMLNRASSNYYLSGFAEYHFDTKVSLRSDNYFYLNSVEEFPFIEDAFRSYFGILYHLNQDQFTNWDITLGFQPGITLMSTTNNTEGLQTFAPIEPSRVVASPSFALSIGAKFYVWKYFNFFANLNYLNSKMGGVPEGPFKTDELVFSAGLGFQINTKGSK